MQPSGREPDRDVEETVRYFALINDGESMENPHGLYREVKSPGRFDIQFYGRRGSRKGKWVTDGSLLRFRYKGDFGSYEITSDDAEMLIDRWNRDDG